MATGTTVVLGTPGLNQFPMPLWLNGLLMSSVTNQESLLTRGMDKLYRNAVFQTSWVVPLKFTGTERASLKPDVPAPPDAVPPWGPAMTPG